MCCRANGSRQSSRGGGRWPVCREDKGDLMAAYFLHRLAGDEMPALKSKYSHLKVVK
jgi:hypothetical protein